MLVERTQSWWANQTKRVYTKTFSYFGRDNGQVVELSVDHPDLEMMDRFGYSLLSQFKVVGTEDRRFPFSRWSGRNLFSERITNLLSGESWSVRDKICRR